MASPDNPTDRCPILIVGDAAVPTGFCRVIEEIFRPLQDRFEIHHLGTNYHGDPHPYDWKVYPAGLGGGIWGTHRLAKLIETIQPKLIFIINDIWIQVDYMKELDGIDNRPPVVMYCPVDAGPLDPEPFNDLEGVDRFVTYTQFAKREVDAALTRLRNDRPDFRFPNVEVVPHGVATDDFFPLVNDEVPSAASRLKARQALFADQPDLHDAFLVLNANRNQPRKRIDITIRAFAKFADGKPANVKLFLHMGAEDQGWDVVRLAKRYGIEDRLVLSTMEKTLPYFKTKHLNHVYNACDVGLNTAVGEGWGLVSFEHAATGAAQIIPDHNACSELWTGAGVMVKPVMGLIVERILTEGWLVSPDDVADALERLYADSDYRTEMSRGAHSVAMKHEYRWSVISDHWRRLFDDLLREHSDRPAGADGDTDDQA